MQGVKGLRLTKRVVEEFFSYYIRSLKQGTRTLVQRAGTTYVEDEIPRLDLGPAGTLYVNDE